MPNQQQELSERTPQWMEWGISVLNGMIGDYLHNRRNGLAIEMACYHRNRPLPLTTESLLQAYPNPGAKLCVLLHGLGCNEGVWTFPDTAPGDSAQSYGTLLQRELGYTPFYLRYNTGLPVADNGKALAGLLDNLLNCYPVGVEDIVLIGHSMGGLVLRSACHYGIRQDCQWVDKVKRVFYLGTPHEGAALEQVGHVAVTVLQKVPNPITQLIGKILDRRSQGVKDLRSGTWLAEDGLDDDLEVGRPDHRRTVSWLAHARHYLLVGTLTEDPNHALTLLLGDALVRLPRACGQVPPATGSSPVTKPHIKIFPKVDHMRLAHDADVYSQSSYGVAMSEGGPPMSRLSLQQIRGVADLIHDTVAGSVDAIEETHQAIVRRPFALLKQIDPIAAPVRTVEHIERSISGGVYQSIRVANRLAATLSTQVLDWLEETEEPPQP